jgi:hypothetical protein
MGVAVEDVGTGFGAAAFGTSPFGVEAAADQSVTMVGIGTGEAFGAATITVANAPDQFVSVVGIATGEAFGIATFMVTGTTGTTGVTLFPAGREGFLDGTVDWDTGTVRVSLIRDYTVDETHRYVSSVTGTGGSLVASADLAVKTTTGGVADAEDIIFPTVAAGAPITVLLIFQASAPTGGADVAPGAQRLIGYLDSPPGLPFIPNGTDVSVVWSNDRTRIFML